MALIHEQLYRSENLASIEFGGYVTSLVASLRRSAANDLSLVPVHIDVDPISLEIDQAMPLGLIINEVVTNSFKHAFGAQPPEDAALWIRMAAEPPGHYTLTIRDNGQGIPAHIDLELPVSMGMQLVQSFVLQLGGQLTVERQPSAAFTVVIPEANSPHG
jgi:two-component sensor histidine kinase